MSNKILPKVKSLSELRRLATDGPLSERYTKLALLAASNLGAMCTELRPALRYLSNEADASDSEDGVMGEVNFVRDIEAARG